MEMHLAEQLLQLSSGKRRRLPHTPKEPILSGGGWGNIFSEDNAVVEQLRGSYESLCPGNDECHCDISSLHQRVYLDNDPQEETQKPGLGSFHHITLS